MVRRATLLATATALAASLAPAAALACPACANNSGGGPGQSIALGFFLLLPFTAAGVVFWLIRSDAREARPRVDMFPSVPSVLGHASSRSEAQ